MSRIRLRYAYMMPQAQPSAVIMRTQLLLCGLLVMNALGLEPNTKNAGRDTGRKLHLQDTTCQGAVYVWWDEGGKQVKSFPTRYAATSFMVQKGNRGLSAVAACNHQIIGRAGPVSAVMTRLLVCAIAEFASPKDCERVHSNNQGWMGLLNLQAYPQYERMTLAHLSVAGSHDSGTNHLSSLAKAQTDYIGTQLNNGARYLDIRPCNNFNGDITTCHGISNYPETLYTALRDVANVLRRNPNEIIFIKMEHQDTVDNNKLTKLYNDILAPWILRPTDALYIQARNSRSLPLIKDMISQNKRCLIFDSDGPQNKADWVPANGGPILFGRFDSSPSFANMRGEYANTGEWNDMWYHLNKQNIVNNGDSLTKLDLYYTPFTYRFSWLSLEAAANDIFNNQHFGDLIDRLFINQNPLAFPSWANVANYDYYRSEATDMAMAQTMQKFFSI